MRERIATKEWGLFVMALIAPFSVFIPEDRGDDDS